MGDTKETKLTRERMAGLRAVGEARYRYITALHSLLPNTRFSAFWLDAGPLPSPPQEKANRCSHLRKEEILQCQSPVKRK